MKRRQGSTQSYELAMRRSMEELISKGIKVSYSSVTKNATYASGKKVGESTLSVKNCHGAYVHEKLRNDISVAVDLQKKGRLKKSTPKSIYSDEILLRENQSLIDEIVKLRFQICEMERDLLTNRRVSNQLQEKIYIAYAVADKVAKGRVLSLRMQLHAWSREQNLDDAQLKKLNAEAEHIINSDSTDRSSILNFTSPQELQRK